MAWTVNNNPDQIVSFSGTQNINRGWYDPLTGMVICSNKLLICNEDVIPCL